MFRFWFFNFFSTKKKLLKHHWFDWIIIILSNLIGLFSNYKKRSDFSRDYSRSFSDRSSKEFISYNQGNSKESKNSSNYLSNLSNSFNFGGLNDYNTNSPFLSHQNQKNQKKGQDGLSSSRDQKVFEGKNRHVSQKKKKKI